MNKDTDAQLCDERSAFVSNKYHFLRIMFSSFRLREVFFAVGTREMVSAYGRCPFMGGYKYRVFLRKRLGLQNGVRLQGVSAYEGCPLGGVRL